MENDQLYNRIRYNVKLLRHFYELSVKELASKAQISQSLVRSIESGNRHGNLESLVRISNAFGLKISVLTDEDLSQHLKDYIEKYKL